MNRRSFLIATSSLVASTFANERAFAQAAYPQQTIKVIVPFPAGGAVDATMRIIEPKLRELLGQPIVIENKPGANGSVGATEVSRSNPDGYTLLFAPREVFAVNPILQAKPAYDGRRDFSPVTIATEAPYVLIVHAGLGVKSLPELVERAKGGSLAYASFGHGSMAQLNIETLAQHLGIKLLHVPYRGAPPAVQAVVTGEVAMSISTPPAAIGFLSEGKILALAVGSERRISLLPDAPTFEELKQPADLFVPASFAMAAPAQTPHDVVRRLNQAMTITLADPAVAERVKKAGLVVVASSPETMMHAIDADIVRFSKLIKATGIKAE